MKVPRVIYAVQNSEGTIVAHASREFMEGWAKSGQMSVYAYKLIEYPTAKRRKPRTKK